MTVHWHYLALALITLWFPRQWLRLGKLQKRKSRKERETLERFNQDGAKDPEDKSVKLAKELRKPRNYIDFFRALVGSYCLWHFAFETTKDVGSTIPFLACAAISTIAVVIQSVRWRERITFFAGVFFYAGFSAGLGNSYPGALAFLLVCAVNPVIPNPRLFVVAYALLLAPFNYMLGDDQRLAGFNTALLLLVPLWSVLINRPMVIFMRKRDLMW